MTQTKPKTWVAAILFVFATVNAIQFYVLSTRSYLDIGRYMAGTERLPFQERVFPIPFLRLLHHVAASTHFLRAGNGVFTQELFGPFILSLISFAIACVFVVLLYRSVSRTRALSGLVAPVFLALMMATYVIRSSARLFYPYDMPSVAFFAAGLFFIYERKFVPLFLVVLIATFNRETTLFLIVIFVLDAAVVQIAAPSNQSRMRWQQVPWLRVVCLVVVWVGIKLYLGHVFAGNDRSEDYNRFWENLHRITPGFLPSILNICGYVLPVVFLYRKQLGSDRLAAWLLVVPMWVVLMLFVGVITESRIYGELLPLAAVATTVMLEERTARGHAA